MSQCYDETRHYDTLLKCYRLAEGIIYCEKCIEVIGESVGWNKIERGRLIATFQREREELATALRARAHTVKYEQARKRRDERKRSTVKT